MISLMKTTSPVKKKPNVQINQKVRARQNLSPSFGETKWGYNKLAIQKVAPKKPTLAAEEPVNLSPKCKYYDGRYYPVFVIPP